MKSFWGLIPRNLIKNKKRNTFIAIGIILSMCLIISLNIMLDILKKSSYESTVNHSGGVYDIQFSTSDRNSLSLLKKDPSINGMSVGINLGIFKLPNSKYTIDINGYDKNITEFINYKLKQGRYPQNDNEIAIEDWVLEKMPKKYKIGDKISLPSIISYTNSKGKPDNLNIDNQLTLVGTFQYIIGQNGAKNKAEAYVTRKYAETKLPPEFIKYNGYLTINPKNTIDKGLELLTSTNEYEKVFFNENFSKAMLLRSFKMIDFVSVVLYIIISVVASVIIYNIFNISVTERIKEFGILRAVGSSPGQIKMLVLGEGLILGCIFIPIGIIIGNIVVRCIIALISGYRDFSGIFKIPSSGIITSFAVGFLSIILGTYSPARKASKISPIEAISSQNNLGLTSQKLKKRLQKKGVMGKFFGFTADMAYLNLNRNKKRFITTVISLSISIIMFLTVSYLINCSDPIKNLRNRLGGDFIITSTSSLPKDSLTDKDIQDIEKIKNIGHISKQKRIKSIMTISEGQVTPEGLKSLEKESKKSSYAKHQFEQKIYSFHSIVCGSTEEDINNIKDYIVQGKIDINKMNKEPFVILAENLNYSNYTKLNAGDKIKLSHPSYDSDGNYINEINETFTIMAILDSNYPSPDGQVNNVVIMSSQSAEKYMELSGYQQIKINLSKNSNYGEIEKTLKGKVKNNRGVTLTSYKEELEKVKKSNMQTSLIMYSFVIVVAAVSIINLFNIMSMNVMLRKREIGMLRAIGFENNQVVKMIRFEGIYYGFTSAFWGIGLGVAFTYIFYLAARKSFTQGMTWSFPVVTVIVTVLVTILICLIASINASRELFESSIVDSIRGNE